MFDELHDPNPPAITSRHLAEVAERAAGIRRRRNAITGGVAAVALLAAGTVGVAATNRGDTAPIEVADAPLPTVAAAPGEAPAPTTTVLDPASLPPAVPVNPDPEDLPPAIPVNPDPDDSDAGTDVDSGTGADPGDSSIGSDDTSTGTGTSTDTDTDTGESVGDGSPTLDVATAAALRADDPVVAITASGQAVWFPAVSADRDPLVISANADRLDFLADGTAVVNIGPNARLIGSDGDVIGDVPVGRAATVDPSGSLIAGLGSGGTLVVTELVDTAPDDTATGDESLTATVAVTSDRPAAVGTDVMWSNTTGLLVLVTDADGWALSRVASLSITGDLDPIDGAITSVSLTDVSGSDLRFAGVDAAGQIVLHDAGTATLFSITLSGAATESELVAPARSVWFDGSEVITVALDGTLTDATRAGTTTLPGTYLTARR